MPTKRIEYNDGVFFITFTCYNRMHLFDIINGYDLVYKWFDYLKSRHHYILGYVIMPNHLHALIGFQNTGKKISTIVGNGKRFMAYEIVKRLQENKNFPLLGVLKNAVRESDRKRNKQHEVWNDSFAWKECNNIRFIKQKLDYMHDNPCRGKWNLASAPPYYLHSSAKYYIGEEQGLYPVTNYLEMQDVDLTELIKVDES